MHYSVSHYLESSALTTRPPCLSHHVTVRPKTRRKEMVSVKESGLLAERAEHGLGGMGGSGLGVDLSCSTCRPLYFVLTPNWSL